MAFQLIQGAVHGAPVHGKSLAYSGIQPLSLLNSIQVFQPLPHPLGHPPYHYDIENVLPGFNRHAGKAKKMVFHTIGDVGGIKSPEYQTAVANAMIKDLHAAGSSDKPAFLYLLGDVVYYNGEPDKYYDQFYEPYSRYQAPILSIPGNHDGDPVNAAQTSLDGWTAYFMTAKPHIDPISRDAPRVTLSLPNVYYTLVTPYATIVGMYTNVPEHGTIDSVQQQWLTHELHAAPEDKALIVALHHPIYSFDAFHSGSPTMAKALEQSINDSRRVPNIFLTGHVHNYQRIEKEITRGVRTPFIVAGFGGYYNLHHLTVQPGQTDTHTGAKLISGEDKTHGYLTLTIDSTNVSGAMTSVSGTKTKKADQFTYSSKAVFLRKNETVRMT